MGSKFQKSKSGFGINKNAQLRWELLKDEIQKYTKYPRKLAKERRENKKMLENKLKELQVTQTRKITFSHIIYTKRNLILSMVISYTHIGVNAVKNLQSLF